MHHTNIESRLCINPIGCIERRPLYPGLFLQSRTQRARHRGSLQRKPRHLLVLKVGQLDQNLGRRVLHVQLLEDGRPIVSDGHIPHLTRNEIETNSSSKVSSCNLLVCVSDKGRDILPLLDDCRAGQNEAKVMPLKKSPSGTLRDISCGFRAKKSLHAQKPQPTSRETAVQAQGKLRHRTIMYMELQYGETHPT